MRHTPSIRWYASLRALGGTPSASWKALDADVARSDIDLPIPLKAKAGQKLVELGEDQEAHRLLQEAIAHPGQKWLRMGVPPRVKADPDKETRIVQNTIDLATVAHSLDAGGLNPVGGSEKMSRDLLTRSGKIAKQKDAIARTHERFRKPTPDCNPLGLEQIARFCHATSMSKEAASDDLIRVVRIR